MVSGLVKSEDGRGIRRYLWVAVMIAAPSPRRAEKNKSRNDELHQWSRMEVVEILIKPHRETTFTFMEAIPRLECA